MTVKLGARIEADVSPLVEALATAGQALDQFEGRVQAANDELTQIGDTGSASLGSLAGGAGQAADALAPLGAAAEAVRAVAAAAQDGDAALGTFSETGGAAVAALTSLFEVANDNRGFAGITTATGEAADGLERLGGTGSAALAALVQPAADAETAVAGLAPVADGAGQALADLLGAAGNTEGLNQLAQSTAGVGEALSSLTAGDEGFARDLAANQQQLSALATARTEISQTLRDADQENADASQAILDQANRIAEDGFAARVDLERQFWADSQGIEEAGGQAALEVMTSALAEQNTVMAEELAKRNQTAREQAAELRTTLDDSYKEYLAPAVGLPDDVRQNNRDIIPLAGARLNAALEGADFGSVNETWQEVVTRFVSDGLDKLQEAGTRAFGTLRDQGAAAFDELAAGTGNAETAATAFGAALDGIGDAAGAALAGLGSLVSGGVKEAEHELTAAGAAATEAGHQIEAAGSGGAAMGHAVAEGAKAGGDALNEVARLGEDVAIGMAARAGTVGQVLRSLGPIGLGAAAAIGALWLAFDNARKAEDDLTAINQALARTGASATMTAHDVQALAESLAGSTLQSRDEVLKITGAAQDAAQCAVNASSAALGVSSAICTASSASVLALTSSAGLFSHVDNLRGDVASFLRVIETAPERGEYARRPLRAKARIILPDGAGTINCWTRDLSLGGASLDAVCDLPAGSAVGFRIDGIDGELPARIACFSDQATHIQFRLDTDTDRRLSEFMAQHVTSFEAGP